MSDSSATPVRIEGTVTLSDGRTSQFAIGDVAGDITWQQWGANEETLYRTVRLLEGLTEKIHEDDLLTKEDDD